MIFINTHNSSGLTWKSIMIINFRFHFPVVESKILWNKFKSSLGQEIYLNIRTSHRSSLHDHVANAGRFQVQDQHLPKIKQIYMYYYIFQEKKCNIFLYFYLIPNYKAMWSRLSRTWKREISSTSVSVKTEILWNSGR